MNPAAEQPADFLELTGNLTHNPTHKVRCRTPAGISGSPICPGSCRKTSITPTVRQCLRHQPPHLIIGRNGHTNTGWLQPSRTTLAQEPWCRSAARPEAAGGDAGRRQRGIHNHGYVQLAHEDGRSDAPDAGQLSHMQAG